MTKFRSSKYTYKEIKLHKITLMRYNHMYTTHWLHIVIPTKKKKNDAFELTFERRKYEYILKLLWIMDNVDEIYRCWGKRKWNLEHHCKQRKKKVTNCKIFLQILDWWNSATINVRDLEQCSARFWDLYVWNFMINLLLRNILKFNVELVMYISALHIFW